MGNDKQYYVYILTNKSNKVLYIGVTNNLIRRIFEHKNKLVEGFTKKYNLKKLIYYESTNHVQDAIKREKQLKNWHRDWKINLIDQFNPEWQDLSEEFVRDAETSLK
ncbi:GIY-YIG nuclease family protein [candidate division WOR-3 bacterium]|jgi:putative endonuclease|nr:GIY-YIG nuclease family protein [candidate division WOR-3 bacterium]MCK4672520.1 GIY-YIG nuclease family protein [candidate division WOR-3 bacterium]